MAAASSEVVMKILVLGDPATGKTSFIKRTISNDFSGVYKPTVGVDFHLKIIVESGKTVHMQLWDIAGQDRFGSIYRVYYQDAFGAFVVFDLADKKTFDSVPKWKREIDSKVRLPNEANLPVLLVANKCDLPHAIDTAILSDFAKEHGFIGWMATSAKENTNVEESVRLLVRTVLSHESAFRAQAAARESGAGRGDVTLDGGKGGGAGGGGGGGGGSGSAEAGGRARARGEGEGGCC